MHLNTFLNTFLYYFQNIVLIHSFHCKFKNERNIRHKIVARVRCFLRFCIKPMRYIYHPQLDCYLVAVNSDCSRPCELIQRGL